MSSGCIALLENVEGYGLSPSNQPHTEVKKGFQINASRVVPTGTENKPYSILAVPIFVY